MSDYSSPAPEPSIALPCHLIVYRMLPTASGWQKSDGTVVPAAFYRRRRDTDGISLATTIQEGINRLAKYGIAVNGVRSLHVGWVRDIGGLDVEFNRSKDPHPVITGLPYSDDNPREAERLATRLRNISRPEVLPTKS
ncbi:MAG TPA: hypothetical protein VGX24_07355 [Pyrinomonadaceae bacterium]|jgi:hypothetical protein|nr:hypothetical protein [Pyrinomonadaceae bacterium]